MFTRFASSHDQFVWVSVLDDQRNLWGFRASYSCKDLYLHALASFAKVMKDSDPSNVQAILLYDGNDDDFRKKARSIYNLTIINTQFSLATSSQFKQKSLAWQTRAGTTFMRIDTAEHIRKLGLDCKYALVTDVDIIFVKDPRPLLSTLKPEKFCACPEEPFEKFGLNNGKLGLNYVNGGIRWINIDFSYNILPALRKFILSKNFEFPFFDQDAFYDFYNTYYQNFQVEQMPPTLNWKAYWGTNPEAIIVHFHGPKPDHFEEYLQWHDQVENPSAVPTDQVAHLLSWPAPFGSIFVKFMRLCSPDELRKMIAEYHFFDL